MSDFVASKYSLISEIKEDQLYKDHAERIDLFQKIIDVNEESLQSTQDLMCSYIQNHSHLIELFFRFINHICEIRTSQRYLYATFFDLLYQESQSSTLKRASFYNDSFGSNYFLIKGMIQEEICNSIHNIFSEFKNTDEKLELLYNGYKQNALSYYLLYDDLHNFQKACQSRIDFDFNQNLELCPFQYDAPESKSLSLFDTAIYYGAILCFKYLILNECNFSDMSQLYAVQSGNSQIIHYMEQKNISFNDTLKACIGYHRNEIFDYLLLHYKHTQVELTDLIQESIYCYNDAAFLFFFLNLSSDQIDKMTYWSNIFAAGSGNIPLLQHLIGPYQDDTDQPISILQYAVVRNSFTSIRYLIDTCGFDINPVDRIGTTPLHLACFNGSLPIIKYLISKGAILEATTVKMETPFLMACKSGSLSCVKYLVEDAKCNVHVRDVLANTPLHLACGGKYDCKDLVQYLVEKCDCYVRQENFISQTPHSIAKSCGHTKIKRYLLIQLFKDFVFRVIIELIDVSLESHFRYDY